MTKKTSTMMIVAMVTNILLIAKKTPMMMVAIVTDVLTFHEKDSHDDLLYMYIHFN